MTDDRLEVLVGTLLRFGVLLSALVAAVGGALSLVEHHAEAINYTSFHGEPAELRTLPGIFTSAAHLHSEGIIQLGLLLLISTPVARVALAALGFHLEGDRLYVTVSLIVLAVLLFSMMHAA
ncbi:MAG: DUF1634 domain-containing protein [Acidobacteria bacterium]|nr:DUF1634 domain-containing protein [Acidobacteriota bacterium]MBV9434703.1 DUF1634 domain-containing protein [Acidobacteriota bacterium]